MMRAQQRMLGGSPAILDVIAEARYVASRDAKVLITGERGVGKELLARFIHENSRRRVKPMASINCAAVTETDAHSDREGLFNVANGGTIFLDEIGEMGEWMQALLLRVLENDVDVRIISATSRDLLQQTKDNAFRLDLYYRLNVVNLVIPPLRERREDIRPLFDHFVRLLQEPGAGPIAVSEDVYPRLEAYNWPGNIRELRNVAERTMPRGDGMIRVEDLPVEILHERSAPAASSGLAVAATPVDALAEDCFNQMVNGAESFWTAVYQPFMTRDLTRKTVREIVYKGLRQTKGSYKALAPLFNVQPGDFKRMHSFLQQHDCHRPFQPFRMAITDDRRRAAPPAAKAAG